MKRFLSTTMALAVSSMTVFCAPDAHAFSFYTDVSGGLTRAQGASAFLKRDGAVARGGGTPDSVNSGYNTNFGLFFRPASGNPIIEVHFGVLYRIQALGASIGGATSGPSEIAYTLNTAYPIVRLQVSRLYVGAGLTPFLLQNIGTSLDFLNTRNAGNTTALYFEGGLLWPITPKFSLAASAAMTNVLQGGTTSPGPIIDGLFTMRFYWGFSKDSGSGASSNSNEFKGWRYPFGKEL